MLTAINKSRRIRPIRTVPNRMFHMYHPLEKKRERTKENKTPPLLLNRKTGWTVTANPNIQTTRKRVS